MMSARLEFENWIYTYLVTTYIKKKYFFIYLLNLIKSKCHKLYNSIKKESLQKHLLLSVLTNFCFFFIAHSLN